MLYRDLLPVADSNLQPTADGRTARGAVATGPAMRKLSLQNYARDSVIFSVAEGDKR
jgi:hypothetical protein